MGRYFDATDNEHLALLPAGARSHADIESIAANAEDDLLGFYTRAIPSGCIPEAGAFLIPDEQFVDGTQRYIYLRGYHESPSSAVASFARAFRREIANVIRWRIARDAKKPGVSSESKENGSTAFDECLERSLPPDVGNILFREQFVISTGASWAI